ncbi:hypothetical protein P3G55_00350 [Leptospira sp. 96542]|nr:hypothetical protein [Leptospira sp. 96542]
MVKITFRKVLFFSIPFLIFIFFLPTLSSEDFDSEFVPVFVPSPNKEKYEEQIKCNPSDCTVIPYDDDGKYYDLVWSNLGKNGGKVMVDLLQSPKEIHDPKMEDLVELMREMVKRDGHLGFEPYYIAARGIGFTDFPIVKDIFGVSYNVFKRMRSYFKFGRMENYNAKILYHPANKQILAVYFFHKNYGQLCDTVYSSCDSIEYMDDDLFDKQLSLKLSNALNNGIEIKFNHNRAVLPTTKLDIGNLLDTNRSARLYKWLIIAKKTETKTIAKERFLGLQLAITVLDYSLTAYELIEAIQLYSPARYKKAEIIFENTEEGKQIKSVVFYPLPPEYDEVNDK